MVLKPQIVKEYHIFLASPGDMNLERQEVRRFFEEYNLHTASIHGVRFVVVDWENYAMAGVGRPQELITSQTLEKHHDSLALVVGLMGQRFGSPTGTHESGTEEEFEWALNSYLETNFPEIKWFFRKVEQFVAPTEIEEIQKAVEQWTKVRAFRERLQKGTPQLFYKEFTDIDNFREVFRKDFSLWLSSPERPWMKDRDIADEQPVAGFEPSRLYYQNIVQDFQWLDIAGIDNDRAFQLPLSDMYVRLRVMLDEDSQPEDDDDFQESGSIGIQTALERYPQLVIVGDPGSGKSTFLKYIALMIARSVLDGNTRLAIETLSLEPPLPVPVFVSCWDLSNFIRKQAVGTINTITEFIAGRFAATGSELTTDALEQMLDAGSGCLLFDGLDEVPTEQGRAVVSRLFEKFVESYPKNRYVITSRVRAYTGGTILRGGFTRCDIQEFNREERREFLRNWLALLFRVPREEVTSPGSESSKAFDNLMTAIEQSDGIRRLAVNPLLLTVIAIVHWNRKRLPEQRVEIYDECVDVLLGQRKEAEWAQISKSVDALDEKKEEEIHDDRNWTRKRFAEIALQIALSDNEDITQKRVIEILRPRFLARGAKDDEQADLQAETFLDRQELRSGLLVSRRSNSYRFVHLTFQEYLAAWNLASQEPEAVETIIGPHLREQEWFETLQLLGGEWAKRSDEILDEYIAYLLQNQGTTITQQAPIIALCANILNDVSGVAEIKPNTRETYDETLKDTLQTFHEKSRVPAQTQLEILEALGKLGVAVKEHLISATHSGYYPVRSRALEMLIPHLPDDDLFNMRHILHDRSQETIKTYLSSLLERDAPRTRRMLENEIRFKQKVGKAIANLFPRFLERYQAEAGIDLTSSFLRKMGYWWGGSVRQELLRVVVQHFPQYEQTWELIAQRACEDDNDWVRSTALELLAEGRKDEKETWELIEQRACEDDDSYVRCTALKLLVERYELKERHQIILTRDLSGQDRWALIHGLCNYIDPRAPISKYWVGRCADRLGVAFDEVLEMFQELTNILPLKLDAST